MILEEYVIEHLKVIKTTFNAEFLNEIKKQGNIIADRVSNGGKILFMGNGGSAADCQHIAAEFVSKLEVDRVALPALALTVDTSAITAIGNDYGFNNLFSRQLDALCSNIDVVVGISTSGKSENIIKGFQKAESLGAHRIGFSGKSGMFGVHLHSDFRISSTVTARIQEAHILLGHLLCLVAEKKFV